MRVTTRGGLLASVSFDDTAEDSCRVPNGVTRQCNLPD